MSRPIATELGCGFEERQEILGMNVHFIVLTIGSAVFVYNFSEVAVSGAGDRALLEIWAIVRRLELLAYYVAFVALVIGHGVLGGRTRERRENPHPNSMGDDAEIH